MHVEETVRQVDVRWSSGTRGALFVRGLGEREREVRGGLDLYDWGGGTRQHVWRSKIDISFNGIFRLTGNQIKCVRCCACSPRVRGAAPCPVASVSADTVL